MRKAVLATSLALGLALPVALAGPSDNSLVIGASQEPSALEYIVNSQAITREVMGWMYRDLTYVDLEGEYQPDLATEIPSEANGRVRIVRNAGGDPTSLTARWTIRNEANWSDGRPVVSEDFRLFFEIAGDRRVPVITRTGYPRSLRVIDAKNFEVVYDPINIFYQKGVTPDDYFNVPAQVWGPIWTRVKAQLEGKTPDQQRTIVLRDLLGANIATSRGGPPVANGPFRFQRWVPGQSLTMVRNPGYWQRNPNGVARITYRFIANTATLQTQLLAGQLDATSRIGLANSPATLKVLRENAGRVYDITQVESTAWENLIVNKFGEVQAVADLGLNDVRTRQALLYAIDRPSIINNLLGGTVSPTNTFVSPSSPVYTTTVAREYPYNPARATQILTELGWRRGSDGILERSVGGRTVKFVLEFVTTAGNAVRERNQQFISQNLAQIGIGVRISNAPAAVVFGADYFPRASLGSWKGVFEAAGGGNPLLESGAEFFCDDPLTATPRDNVPSASNSYGGNNAGGWCNAEYDRLWDQARRTLDARERRPLLARMQEIFVRELPSIPLYLRLEVLTTRKGLENYVWNGVTRNPSTLGWLVGWSQRGMREVVTQPALK